MAVEEAAADDDEDDNEEEEDKDDEDEESGLGMRRGGGPAAALRLLFWSNLLQEDDTGKSLTHTDVSNIFLGTEQYPRNRTEKKVMGRSSLGDKGEILRTIGPVPPNISTKEKNEEHYGG